MLISANIISWQANPEETRRGTRNIRKQRKYLECGMLNLEGGIVNLECT
jgi:hypothetical protein